MKSLLLALALVSTCVLAATADPVDEIAHRSGLPASEVSAALADCDATQTNMNFCAWRDQIVAEQKLDDVVDATAGSSTACKTALQNKVIAWKKQRDARCLKSASREWGGGSMLPTAVAMCRTAATERMSKAIKHNKCR
ncbi:lysozyme inhibitor LprI family protein [Paraburkholderia sp. ZP32-5]|uniref:lysozyme inhibitor LprI family protein n=1 Tax=Paraburkholderia sp. ZP32-5 TaxID=2883245 RepID=UPI001F1C16F8|nr:lysozyme inhibitor LprI family protein [Paraburkholderia sp. ZP32-5]